MKGTEKAWGKTWEELNDEERLRFMVEENAYLWYVASIIYNDNVAWYTVSTANKLS